MNLCKMRKEGVIIDVKIPERDINKRSSIVLMHFKQEEKAHGVKNARQQSAANLGK